MLGDEDPVSRVSSSAPYGSFMDGQEGDTYEEEMQSYFGELLGYDALRIQQEPRVLEADRQDRARRLEECVANNYHVYIETNRSIEDLKVKLEESLERVAAVERDVPALQESCNVFRKAAARENAVREQLRHVYANQSSILDLLEVPSLMDTFVRAGNYDEALELKGYGKKLLMIHGGVPVVETIATEVDAVSRVMMEQLLEKLQTNIQLAECLRLVGYLRRLNVFDEAEMKRSFLERRGMWIKGSLRELHSNNAYEYLKKLTDVYRVQLFDVVMQYKAIFSKDAKNKDSLQGNDPLYSWSFKRILYYMSELQDNLTRLQDGGSIASVLDHCMYCGQALGRVGLDFRPIVFPLFEHATLHLFVDLVEVSNETFKEMMTSHRWIAIPSAVNRAAELVKKSNVVDDGDDASGLTTKEEHKDLTNLEPPAVLVEHPPLAVYTNGLLAAFNELRHCAPIAISGDVSRCLEKSFETVVSALIERDTLGIEQEERKIFVKACGLVKSVLFPFIIECYSRIFASHAATLQDENLFDRIPL